MKGLSTLHTISKRITGHVHRKNCNKMGDHIDFVNNVYDTVKVPLHYISNKVQKMIGVTNDDHRAHTSSNKIECANSNVTTDVNDDK